MARSREFGWLQIDDIAQGLALGHPDVDPYGARFPDLRRMVLALPGFREEEGHPVNERILETIQARWIEEREDGPRPPGAEDDE